jgi:hypothetical protein
MNLLQRRISMKCFALFLMSMLLVMAGCSNENPYEAQSQNLAAPASLAIKGNNQSPIKGSFETTFQFIPIVCIDPTSGTPVDRITPGAVPAVVSAPFQGPGQVSHLGKSTVSSSQTVDFTAAPPILYGKDEFTAANGDKLYATHIGSTVVPDAAGNASFSGEFTFTGGTGRFTGASGSVDVRTRKDGLFEDIPLTSRGENFVLDNRIIFLSLLT